VKGLPFDAICDYLGIDHANFLKWKQAGEAYLAGNLPESHKPYGDFVLELRRAVAEYRLRMVERVHAPGNTAWFRDMLVLERRDRKNWGRKDPYGGSMDTTTPPPDERFL
jgi:hypothetical protein